MIDKEITLYLVIPCFNEEQVLMDTVPILEEKLQQMIGSGLIGKESRIAFVDDGSGDGTWQILEKAHETNTLVEGIKLSRNCGHQNAILAGMLAVEEKCDAVITLDADLQDDVQVLDQFVEEFYQGSQIVYGVRSSRKSDTFFKRVSAEGFYKLLDKMGVEIVYNHADYRLMSRNVIRELAKYREVNLFLRGIVPLLGFQTSKVDYERKERVAGESKYPLKKMLALAFNGITSFSIKPMRFITALGILLFTSSIFMLFIFFVKYLCGVTEPGWATIVLSVWGIGGLQLLATGMIGEYIGKIYMETKGRPRYIIEKALGGIENEC